MMPRWLVWVAAAAGVLALLAALLAGLNRVYSNGYSAGQLAERAATQEAMDARQREDQRLASQLAATARAEAQRWRDNAHQLQTENRRARSLLAAAPDCAPAVAAVVDPGGAVAGPGLQAPGANGARTGPGAGPRAGQPPVHGHVPGGAGLWLSAAAVSLWDSALAGRPVPAGACGTADAPAAACDAATAHTLEDAWANHIENAARCGADRAAHQRLIDFLQARQAGAAAQP